MPNPATADQVAQIRGFALKAALEKRRLDQALNAKEFAVCAGVSYSTARGWFHLAGFPAFHGGYLLAGFRPMAHGPKRIFQPA
jgi:hypothetical protein